MRSKLIVIIAALVCVIPVFSQVQPATKGSRVNLSVGGGVDYWKGDWGKIARFGPSAWATAEFWHGLGINAEGHSMIAGGDSPASQYKYFVGEGGLIYSYHRWHKFVPYAKGEMGFASLSFPHKPTSTYTHDTRNTWAVGGGFEYKTWRHIWTRVDYTYDGFPNFYSPVTGHHPTLDPNGFAVGATYHFR